MPLVIENPGALMDTGQVAAALGLTIHGVTKMIARGDLETIKVGRDHLITVEAFRRAKARPDQRKRKLMPGRKAPKKG